MKLVRLSTNNNGNFKSSFGNDMIISPQSKMALLNLTFKSNIGGIPGMQTVDGSTMTITGDVGNALTTNTTTLFGDDFDDGDFERFRKTVEWYLNRLPKISYGNDEAEQINISGSAWRIVDEPNGIMSIDFSYAPFVNPFRMQEGNETFNAIMSFDATLVEAEGLGPGTPGEQTRLHKYDDNPTVDTLHNFLSSVPMAKGSSFFTARVYNLIDNTGTLQDNGFGIGVSNVPLSSLEILPGDEIPLANRLFEMRINKPTEPYSYIVAGNAEQASGVTPLNTTFTITGNHQTHDIMGIEIQNGQISLCVYQNEAAPGTTGIRNVLASSPYNPGEEFYPYIYLRGGRTDCKVDLVNYVCNPYAEPGFDVFNNFDNSAYLNSYDILLGQTSATLNINKQIPNVDAGGIGLGGRWDNLRNFNVGIPENILRALGFTNFSGLSSATYTFPDSYISEYPINPAYGWSRRGNILPIKYDSDNFLIESMSLPLDSFDASRVDYSSNVLYNKETEKQGRRKNILQTIPINDNTTGLVEYQTNTPIFIDINNKESMNVKNLDFRILRKDFTPIDQSSEEAIMTVLISQ